MGTLKRGPWAYVDGLADEAEAATGRQDAKTLYKITKVLSGKYSSCNQPVKDVSGKVIPGESERTKRWKEHFESVLNRPDPDREPDIPASDEPLEINTDPPTIDEVKIAIKRMKSGKAGGLDGITADMLKAEEVDTPVYLHSILGNIWNNMTLPEKWKTGLIIKLPKREIFQIVTIGGVSLYFPSQVR